MAVKRQNKFQKKKKANQKHKRTSAASEPAELHGHLRVEDWILWSYTAGVPRACHVAVISQGQHSDLDLTFP